MGDENAKLKRLSRDRAGNATPTVSSAKNASARLSRGVISGAGSRATRRAIFGLKRGRIRRTGPPAIERVGISGPARSRISVPEGLAEGLPNTEEQRLSCLGPHSDASAKLPKKTARAQNSRAVPAAARAARGGERNIAKSEITSAATQSAQKWPPSTYGRNQD